MTEAYNFLSKHDSAFAESLKPALAKAVNATNDWLLQYFDKTTAEYGGMTLPDFLPH